MNCDECSHDYSHHGDRAVTACDWYGQTGTKTKFTGAGPPVEFPVYNACNCTGWSKE